MSRILSQNRRKKITNDSPMVSLKWKKSDFLLNNWKNHCIKVGFLRISFYILFLILVFLKHNLCCTYKFISNFLSSSFSNKFHFHSFRERHILFNSPTSNNQQGWETSLERPVLFHLVVDQCEGGQTTSSMCWFLCYFLSQHNYDLLVQTVVYPITRHYWH